MGSHLTNMKACVATRSNSIRGNIYVPGDKSISHRALLLGSQMLGTVTIHGLLEGEDVLCTKAALQRLGVNIMKESNSNEWHIEGVGIGGLNEPSQPLDMGNSGTGARLLMGLTASYPFTSFFYGDESLSRRPMKRVITPLSQMGVEITARSENRLPLAVKGTPHTVPIRYELPVASAQVKSCILLAGLNIAGTTTVIEPHPTRDHTERMLEHMGIPIKITTHNDGKTEICIDGHAKQKRQNLVIQVPSDPSSAAFPIVAALIVPDSDIVIENVCMNPLRTGLFDVLKRMGADITFSNERENAGEPVADIHVRHSKLKGIEVEADAAPSMIDEYPILSIAAAFAEGTTTMHGLGELRVKESDRFNAIVNGLHECGVEVEAKGDSLIVTGGCGSVKGGGTITTHYDHRIAMSFLVLGLASNMPVIVDDSRAIATSFPNFIKTMTAAGAFITQERRRHRRPNREHPFMIAIDGPAASGKGTLARRLAERLGLPYLDTGLLYRAVGMKLVYQDQDPSDKQLAIEAALSIDDEDFSNPRLRQERVGQAASKVSAIPEVRAILLDYQRNFAASPRGAVLDGRDIGTVVCPEANLKVFMTASIETRADRRHRQLQGQGIEVVYESVKKDLQERDRRDSERQNAPLVAAPDAISVDTTDMTAEEVFTHILTLIDNRMEEQAA